MISVKRYAFSRTSSADRRPTFRSAASSARDWGLGLLLLGLLIYAAVSGAASSGYNWQWDRALPYFLECTDSGCRPGILLRQGLMGTLRISALALCLALSVGFFTAAARLAGGPTSRAVGFGYVQLFRNTPLMVQLVAAHALIPVSWGFSATGTAVTMLGLFEGAYMAEIFRTGIIDVPKGQWEAARSLGLPTYATWLRVILPHSLRRSLPPLVSQCVSLIKDSSLVGIIAVTELTQLSGMASSDTFLSFEIWLPTAVLYLLPALGLSALAALLQARLNKGLAVPLI